MLICIMGHIRDAAQILADELSEDTVALSMKDADPWEMVLDTVTTQLPCFF